MQNKLQPPLNPIALQQYLLYLANQQQLQRFVQAQIQYRLGFSFNVIILTHHFLYKML